MSARTARTARTQVPGEMTEATETVSVAASDSGEYPNASTIDAATLVRAVRTKQGWLCPTPKKHPAQL